MIHYNFKRDVNHLVGPILLETLLTFLLGGVDTFMLSQYSDAAVAAVGVDNQILSLVFLLFTIINAGTSVLCAQYLGAGREEKFIRVGIVALALNLVVGLAVSLTLFLGADSILTLMGLRPELMVYGRPYMQIVGGMAFTQAISTTVSTILRSAKMPVPPMMVVGVVNVLNIMGNYILIFGKFGMPEMGAEMERLGCRCSLPEYCFTHYLEPGYKEDHILIETCEAVTEKKEDSALVKFRELPEITAACIFHKGSYNKFPETYAAILRFIEDNGYEICGNIRENYIDGIWNKDREEDWLSEIQIPVRMR